MYWVRMEAGTVMVTKGRGLEEDTGSAEVEAEAEVGAEPEIKGNEEADVEVKTKNEPEF